ncbi:MAG: hypothetical protein HC809_02400 [Gammaproteobacteria bacterium]|nr:hypothetical protein [Gammaproteobacteria bacterium]
MSCNQLAMQIDEFMDGELSASARAGLDDHIRECTDCAAVYAAEQTLRASLGRLPVEAPSAEYFERALAFARRQRRRNDPRRSSKTGTFALAAVATIVLAIGAMTLTQRFAPSAGMPEVMIALEGTGSVNLVFSTTTALAGAKVSLEIPEGIEVVGYPGRRSLEWTTDLRPGKNVLRVPLLAHAAVADELVARLSHDSGAKEFRVRVRVI